MNHKVFRSWKEIAAYLHRTVRTCQRWEREYSLPVHREDGAPRANVYAYQHELDVWLMQKFHEPEITQKSLRLVRRVFTKRALAVVSAVVLVAIIGFFLWRRPFHPAAGRAGGNQPSVAVLPFVDLHPDKAYAYLCDGLVSALIDDLSTVPNLRTCALTTTLSLKGKSLDAKEIGRQLNVDSMVEGSVRADGESLQLSVRLVSAKNGFTLWSQRYADQLKNLISIEQDIIRGVASTLGLALQKEGPRSFSSGSPPNSEALSLYLRGRYFLNKKSLTELNKSVSAFGDALRLAPDFAAACAGLADCYVYLASFGFRPPSEALPLAKGYIKQALEIDTALPAALTSLGLVEWVYEHNFALAEEHLRQSLVLSPHYAETHYGYGNFLFTMGRMEEGLEELKLALEKDPLSLMINASLAYGHYLKADYEQAMNVVEHCLELEENFAWAHHIKGCIYRQKRMFKAAEAEFRQALAISPESSHYLAMLACVQALGGQRDAAGRTLQEVLKLAGGTYVDATDLAEIYVALDDFDGAFKWLETAYDHRAVNLLWLRCSPAFDKIRTDPRYQALVRRIWPKS